MSETILVVEHEAHDADVVRRALAGQPFTPTFIAEGEALLRALDGDQPRVIVLSSPDLISMIRERPSLQQTPVLLTVDGTSRSSEDAMRLGATDVLSRPFSESDFLSKLQQLTARRTFTARHAAPAAAPGNLTSQQIFSDVVGESTVSRKPRNTAADVDALLARTLSDVLPKPKPRQPTGPTALDKKLQDTLSGLEKTARAKPAGTPMRADKIHMSHPVLPAEAAAPAIEEEEPVDGIKFGQYVLLEKIAAGGMAEVWRARMRGVQGFQKIVAIKKILPHLSDNQEFIAMFVDEAKLAAQLSHNNIIHIYDLGHIQDSYYIAMELVDGHDLKTILKRAAERDQPLSEEMALFIAAKIAAALDYAHRKRDFEGHEMGLVHRDVSPQNVLISREGDIKLCDFGIAKAASKASHTQAGALKGKLQYMSPEQARGQSIDRRSDIFALGAVLFEMLTRRQLFTGEHEMSILEQVREARVVPPSQFNDDLTAEVDAIVAKALQREPADRYQTAAEMAKDLESLLYTYRPTPTSADLAIYMHRLDEATPVVVEPLPTAVTVVEKPSPVPAPPPRVVAPPNVAPVSVTARPAPLSVPAKKRSAAMPIAIAVAVIAIAAIGGWFALRTTPAAPAAAAPRTAAVTPAPAPIPTTATETVAPVVATTTEVAVDATKVDEEVQRRLAAERARLEERAREQQRQAPKPVVQPQILPPPAPVAPTPVVAETRPPAPQPTPQPPAEAPGPQPESQPAAGASAAVKEGDFVTDLDGLTPARMTRRAAVAYPPVARMRRIEGTVLVGALVSETGEVLETRILKPVVGLNDAALQIVRRSTFSPPTKNGVRVRAWTTVPIDFKL